MIYCWLLQDEVMLIRFKKKRLVFFNSPQCKQNKPLRHFACFND